MDCANLLVRQYQITLDAILASNPRLQRCLKRCVHCGIRFLTDPRNAGRERLRCPFGCAKHHREQRAKERSKAYRQSDEGREKKRVLNAKRYRSVPAIASVEERSSDEPESPQASTDSNSVSTPQATPVEMELQLDGLVVDESDVDHSPMLPYVRKLIWLIDGVRLTDCGVVKLLQKVLRQHSMAYSLRRDYVLSFLHQHPP